jgi:hypothetical protein
MTNGYDFKDLDRVFLNKTLSHDVKLDDKYEKILEAKIYLDDGIKIDKTHLFLKGSIDNEFENKLKEFIFRSYKRSQGRLLGLDHISRIIWFDYDYLDYFTKGIIDYKEKAFAKKVLQAVAKGHEGIAGHGKSVLHLTLGDIGDMYTIIFTIVDNQFRDTVMNGLPESIALPTYFVYDKPAHEAFAIFNEEYLWKKYEEYSGVKIAKNNVQESRNLNPIYKKAYEMIKCLQNLKNFDYGDIKRLFDDPPKSIFLERKKTKECIGFSCKAVYLLYNTIFYLRKGLKASDIKGYIEDEIKEEGLKWYKMYPYFEEIDKILTLTPSVVFNNSYFCIFPTPKENCYELKIYAPIGYMKTNSNEILSALKAFMNFSKVLNEGLSYSDVLKELIYGEALFVKLLQRDGPRWLVYDAEKFHKMFLHILLNGNLDKYKTIADLFENILNVIKPKFSVRI